MRRTVARLGVAAVTGVLAGAMAVSTAAFADFTGSPGQPSQSCGSSTAPSTPGNAASSPGSAFNPNGQAPSVYAGQQSQNSVNPHSVAQYDVACFQNSQPHP